MKVKNAGVLVELDPKKEYIMLIDAEVLSEEHARNIKPPLNGMIFYGSSIAKGITFVENSDKIVGIKYLK